MHKKSVVWGVSILIITLLVMWAGLSSIADKKEKEAFDIRLSEAAIRDVDYHPTAPKVYTGSFVGGLFSCSPNTCVLFDSYEEGEITFVVGSDIDPYILKNSFGELVSVSVKDDSYIITAIHIIGSDEA